MIRFRLSELIADKQFSEGRRVTLLEIAEATGVNRMTLSRMINHRGYNTVTDNLDQLCKYFGCSLSDLAVYVPTEAPRPAKKQNSTPKRKAIRSA